MSKDLQMTEISLSSPHNHDMPYTDNDNDSTVTASLNGDKPYVRFYAVGPHKRRMICPLCHEDTHGDKQLSNGFLGQLGCMLSTCSCCFPILSLCLAYVCLQSRLKSRRVFCRSCGGHIGFYWKPT